MPVPDYGAAPLAKTFLLARSLALISMLAIVGMTANFVAQMIGSNVEEPPTEMVGTLVITCVAALYCLISIPFFYAQADVGLLVMTVTDILLLLAFIVVAVVLGKPLSFLNCTIVADDTAAANSRSVAAFTQALASNIGESGGILDLGNWAASTKANCYETKAIWGLCIGLAILFTCSSCILPTLWYKARKAGGAGGKTVV